MLALPRYFGRNTVSESRYLVLVKQRKRSSIRALPFSDGKKSLRNQKYETIGN
jgi:hypothetical protein